MRKWFIKVGIFPRFLRWTCFHQNHNKMKLLHALIYTILITNVTAYGVVPKLSFSAPFKKFNYSGRYCSFKISWIGNRVVDGWECAGDSVINEYFIRLTPDRQSKNGFCWSRSSFGNGEWVTTIKFRISGQVVFYDLTLFLGS